MSQEDQVLENENTQTEGEGSNPIRQYKRLRRRPIRTGLSKRCPSYTIKDGFQYKNKSK